MNFAPYPLRAQFPALAQEWQGRPLIFFDNPGGTQVPESVIEATAHYYRESNANIGGAFETSRRTDAVIAGARSAMADLLNAPAPETIVFGPNMTSLTFQMARAFGRTIRPGDEIIVTNLDHDANVTPWTDLQEAGAIIKVWDIENDCTLNPERLRALLSERTRLLAMTHASNAVGTIPDVAASIQLAHSAGALVYVDAVQFTPHGSVDVQALDCDFLACSAYKFFGPHVGALYGKAEHLVRLTPYKVRPAKNLIPNRWETGTLNHEGLAAVTAAVDYLAQIGRAAGAENTRRQQLKRAMETIRAYEKTLSAEVLTGLSRLEGIRVQGLTDLNRLEERLPTFACTLPHCSPRAAAEYLGAQGICCWSGNYYALRLMERLGLEAQGGALRIGLAHYNTREEVERLLETLETFLSRPASA